jgi:hypothetical protein
MSYKVKVWKIINLNDLYSADKLNLNPPYQRNSIWSLQAQKLLIDTIKKNLPIPAFFIQEKQGGSYEMVDGQQRTRAILSYTKENGFIDKESKAYVKGEFDNYEIAVNILSKDLTIEEVREFYVRVNRSGARLERPELNKAEYFDTNFLKLVSELSDLKEFKDLHLFSAAVEKRMFDRDFIEELVAQYLYGIGDKKKAVDNLFKEDIDKEKYLEIKKGFTKIIQIISKLNEITSFSKTRFIQKNDFYTLFGFIKKIQSLPFSDIDKLFRNFVKISKGISPSNDNCEPLKEYAINCVLQSNSKKARTNRFKIIENILLNDVEKPNKRQRQIIKYFNLEYKVIKVNNYYIIDL